MLLAAVKKSDAGMYTCIRANEAGQISGSAYLDVLGKYVHVVFILTAISQSCK